MRPAPAAVFVDLAMHAIEIFLRTKSKLDNPLFLVIQVHRQEALLGCGSIAQWLQVRAVSHVQLTWEGFWRTDHLEIFLTSTREDPQPMGLTIDPGMNDIFEIGSDVTGIRLESIAFSCSSGTGKGLPESIAREDTHLLCRFLIVSNIEIKTDKRISGRNSFQLLQLINERHRIPLVVDG